MRFTSLVIELIRARPRLVVWLVVVLQAILWLLVALVLYRSPPGDLATVLALGREYRVGTDLGPPLAFWLADIAFRAAGNHMIGVYLLAQLCSIATFWTLYLLARATVGGQQAVLAVLLTMTVLAFSAPGLEFGPLVLARPIWALLLLHSWQLIGQNRRNAWFAWSIEAGLLLLTTSAAIALLAFVVGFALATARGPAHPDVVRRAVCASGDCRLALPYLIWLIRADALGLAAFAVGCRIERPGSARGRTARRFAAGRIGSLRSYRRSIPRWLARTQEEAPVIFRPPVDPAARDFVYFFAFAPALLGCLISGLYDLDRVVGGAGIVLLMSGLAAIVACGDLIYLRRQRILRTIWAAVILAPALAVIAATFFIPWTDEQRGDDFVAGSSDRKIFRRQF